MNIIMYTIIITNAGNKFNTNLQKNYDKIRKKYRYFCDIMLKSKKIFFTLVISRIVREYNVTEPKYLGG